MGSGLRDTTTAPPSSPHLLFHMYTYLFIIIIYIRLLKGPHPSVSVPPSASPPILMLLTPLLLRIGSGFRVEGLKRG